MTGLDWAIVIVIALSVVPAAAQGFFFELFSLGGAILGFVLAAWESWRLAPWFEPYVKSAAMAQGAAFLAVFLSVMLIAGTAGKLSRWAMQEVGLRWMDRLLGAAFGLARGVVVATVAVMALATFAPDSPWLRSSELGRYFLLSARVAVWVAPAKLQSQFHEGVILLRRKQMEMASPSLAGSQENKSVPAGSGRP